MNRRKFINNIIRGSVLSGLGAMSAVFVVRNRKNTVSGCNFDFVCKNCKKNNNCMLPEAALYQIEQKAKNTLND